MVENGILTTQNGDSAFADTQEGFTEGGRRGDLNETEENISGSKDFMELFEESLKGIQEGKVIKGEIVKVDKEYVLVDIGYKSEGQIRINEFVDSEGHLTATVGDEVDVLLVRKEDKDGRIILSKEKAARVKIWDEVEDAYRKRGTVRGEIVHRVKGGLSVDIGLQAFLPGSQADLRPVRNLDSLIGKEYDFRIVTYEKHQGNIVLSRRAALEAERMALREKTFELLEEGAILEGIVRNITDYGLFIDLGGIDGLVHITDMSWGRTGRPSEIYNVGEKTTVKVLKFDRERERVSLGIKQLAPDPWTKAKEEYPVGAKIEGHVVSLKEYGAFVEVEKGIEGLIHVSEMSWTGKVKHSSQFLNIGDIVNAIVLDIDSSKRRISLGMKQLEPNPWDSIAENYPVGTIIEGKIKNITDFGIFIGIDAGIDGLVHISDISWTKPLKHPSELYKKGQQAQAVVLDIDKENERFSMGIKQLKPDPWEEIPEKYKPGTPVSGTVTNITDFGLFIELEEGIEGLIHVSELSKDKGEKPLSHFQVGDVIEACVVKVYPEDKKIRLSVKELEERSQKGIYRSYVNNHTEATSNLGELLKEEIQQSKKSEHTESEKGEKS